MSDIAEDQMSEPPADLGGRPNQPESLQTSGASGVTADRLRSFVERIERLDEERQALADDTKEIYAEAKGQGFDVKTMRKIVRLRKMDTDQRREEEALLETYLAALGME